MPDRTIPLQLPEAIYQCLEQVAHATHHSLDEVVLQTIRGNLPHSLDDLDLEWHGVVADPLQMGDEVLWAVMNEWLPQHQWRRHQCLLRKGREGSHSTASDMSCCR